MHTDMQSTQDLGIRNDTSLALPELLMSLGKQIDLISAAHLSRFLDTLLEWFVSLFLETGRLDSPHCVKFNA